MSTSGNGAGEIGQPAGEREEKRERALVQGERALGLGSLFSKKKTKKEK